MCAQSVLHACERAHALAHALNNTSTRALASGGVLVQGARVAEADDLRDRVLVLPPGGGGVHAQQMRSQARAVQQAMENGVLVARVAKVDQPREGRGATQATTACGGLLQTRRSSLLALWATPCQAPRAVQRGQSNFLLCDRVSLALLGSALPREFNLADGALVRLRPLVFGHALLTSHVVVGAPLLWP